MIDSHCHIDLYPNPLDLAKRIEAAGIQTLSMTNLPSHFALAKTHLKGFQSIRSALGMHPLYANRHLEEEYQLFEKYLDQTSYVGEVGLDFSQHGIATREKQLTSFEFVLQKVSSKRKLLSLHSRGAEENVLQMLMNYKIPLAIFHWYSGSLVTLEKAISNGYFLSVNTSMINSKKGVEIVRNIPLARLLTESDGPFVKFNNRLVEPFDIQVIIEFLAKMHMKSVSEINEILRGNFRQILDTLKSPTSN